MDKRIILLSENIAEDMLGNQIVEYCERHVWATVRSVSRGEFFAAGTNGFRPECAADVWSHEYHDERVAIIDGKKLNVYRAYQRVDGRTELYLADKVVYHNEDQ